MTHTRTSEVSIQDLLDLVTRLRAPGGCPWDREQRPENFRQYLLDECYEVMDAIDAGHAGRLCEELGDLLFLVVFLVRLGEEESSFCMADVLARVHDKMVRRHPHVFGDVKADDAATVKRNWWKIKQNEGTSPSSQLDSVPKHLPALQRALRLGQRAARAGLDWNGPVPVVAKVHEELRELEDALTSGTHDQVSEELGDTLFALANLGRHLNRNPEELLQRSNNKFVERFRRLERRAAAEGKKLDEMSPEHLDAWWEEEKRK